MHTFQDLAADFSARFNIDHFPESPRTLYEPGQYFLQIGGKRIRPVMCLMGNELFDAIKPDAYHVATAIELFHNFTLIHDDIMDKAPLRRGMKTVHEQYGENTALLSGDVMLIKAYDYLNKINATYLHKILHLFNKTASQVCEGQQLDMDFEKQQIVALDEYIRMVELKTSVLIAASLQMGAILGGAGEGNAKHLYEFGRNLGIAFQVQDDYLDAFGDPGKFGKKVGGDIVANKKTFLLIYALEIATGNQAEQLQELISGNEPGKVEKVLEIFKSCGVDAWAKQLKDSYINTAFKHLEDTAVLSARKKPLEELASFLVHRDY
ncbi:polyprenyl synthetase family protein [Segetibacter sp. 3557_3]|uniref:polyprenyl synthetase family protein n=1 Tax=Segetibacter sp. 3557_3 TaxID=2547429 RepID=UPI001058DA0B|nr:polyprenyl synthetase family protein [Segetibacter sp. 3557_3]TDH29173.1 polyprenyl synthetase family protein [Segetibacter sp. 3557_3]